MAQLISVTIEDVKSYQREGKYGAFYEYQYKADGSVYRQNGKVPEAPIKVGDEVQILFDSKQDDKYGIQNKVVQINKVGESTNTVATVPKPHTSGLANAVGGRPVTKPATDKSTGSTLTPRDISIARMNAVTSAIALLNLTNDTLTVEDVFTKADEIINYTLAPYNSK